MNGILWFAAGFLAGGVFGVIVMALLQIGRLYEDGKETDFYGNGTGKTE